MASRCSCRRSPAAPPTPFAPRPGSSTPTRRSSSCRGDVPLVTAELIRDLATVHVATDAAATMVTMELDDPTGYGRVVRGSDGNVEYVVETKSPG